MALSKPTVLVDTDVLVWTTRGHEGAAARLQVLAPWSISAVTYIELAQGCRDKRELARIKKGLVAYGAVTLPLTAAISNRAVALIDTYAKSHGLQLGDALIAATALEHRLTLLTANGKHFSRITGLQMDVFVA